MILLPSRSRIWPGSKGSIMPVVLAMWRIHLSLLIVMGGQLLRLKDCKQWFNPLHFATAFIAACAYFLWSGGHFCHYPCAGSDPTAMNARGGGGRLWVGVAASYCQRPR